MLASPITVDCNYPMSDSTCVLAYWYKNADWGRNCWPVAITKFKWFLHVGFLNHKENYTSPTSFHWLPSLFPGSYSFHLVLVSEVYYWQLARWVQRPTKTTIGSHTEQWNVIVPGPLATSLHFTGMQTPLCERLHTEGEYNCRNAGSKCTVVCNIGSLFLPNFAQKVDTNHMCQHRSQSYTQPGSL